MSPKRESLDLARVAGVLGEATSILLDNNETSRSSLGLPPSLDVVTLQRLLPNVDVAEVIGNFRFFLGRELPKEEECLRRPLPCDHTAKFRTASGWCNNLRQPHYGNAFRPMRRLLPPAYDDGFDSPRTRALSGRPLPSARRVSNVVHASRPRFHAAFSHMLMQYGQILDHDMMHSPIARGANNAFLNCTACDSQRTLSIHCFPIPIEQGDPHFPATDEGRPRCMPFTRSLLGQVTLGYRNQLNQLTSFLDASTVYGSTECETTRLRLFAGGRLNFTNLGFNRAALPQGTQEAMCRSLPASKCFVAGDERNNEQPGLTVMHTLLMREHNRVATELARINNHWTDERLFQETRRIVIAVLQHISYSEWLPVVLGCEKMSELGLTPLKSGYFTGYDDNCDATISQEMSTAAFRFGHTLIRETLPRMNASYANDTTAVPLKDAFNSVHAMYERHHGHLESILLGLLGAESMDFDRHIASAVRNHLFQLPTGGPITGLDLPAVNIQRGRDHGIPGYNAYREYCKLPRARHFFDLQDTMDSDAISALAAVYENVDDVDLFPGIMSERPINGALVGPSLACLIGEQMSRLKKCDRFFYENDSTATARFSPGQLQQIRRATLSRLICDNSEWTRAIQPNAFLMQDDLTNAPIPCSELPEMDLSEWMDRQFCVVATRVIQLGQSKRVTPCVSCTCTAEGAECRAMIVANCEALLEDFTPSEILADTACAIQCAPQLNTILLLKSSR